MNQYDQKIIAESNSKENALNKSRLNLGSAYESNRQGDIVATRQYLKAAAEWLNKAAKNSKTKKVRDEARKLAIDIEVFKQKPHHVSGHQENSLVRIWHRTTSI